MMVVVVVVMAGVRTHAPHMVMMADLRPAHVALEPDNLFAILAKLAIHRPVAVKGIEDPLLEAFQHHPVIVQIGRL